MKRNKKSEIKICNEIFNAVKNINSTIQTQYDDLFNLMQRAHNAAEDLNEDDYSFIIKMEKATRNVIDLQQYDNTKEQAKELFKTYMKSIEMVLSGSGWLTAWEFAFSDRIKKIDL